MLPNNDTNDELLHKKSLINKKFYIIHKYHENIFSRKLSVTILTKRGTIFKLVSYYIINSQYFFNDKEILHHNALYLKMPKIFIILKLGFIF